MADTINEFIKEDEILTYVGISSQCYPLGLWPTESIHKDTFLCKADGNGMIKAGIHHGDILFVHLTKEARHDSILILRLEDGSTVVRHYLQNDSNHILRRENGSTPDMVNVPFEVLGEVFGTFRPLSKHLYGENFPRRVRS